ncbi:MAG: hypothetical protein ACLP1X_06805 [Polyangiaceae bacterium]|jgi:hypothetical protein
MVRRVGGLGLLAAMVALAVVACRQLVGITDNPPEDLVTSICGLPYGTNACASCVNTNCCAESTTCSTNPACSTYETCLGKCSGDPACRSQCTAYPVSTASDVSALSACLASKCEAACGLTCGGIADLISEPPSAPACQSCIEATSTTCADARAWGASVDGDTYWRCVLACPTEDCRGTCGIDNPSGASLFAPFQTDYAGTCSGPCAYGNYWACVGHVNWPEAKSNTVTVTYPVIDFGSHLGVSGLDVQVCTGCPCDAADPTLGQGQTDDAGVVMLHVRQVVGANGVADNNCNQITSPSMSIVPYFGYTGYPLSETVSVITMANAARLAPETATPTAFAQYQVLDGVTQDPLRGFVGPQLHDCIGSPAPGVAVTTDSNDPMVAVLYDPGSEAIASNSSGIVSIFNVPPGVVTLTATPVALHKTASVVTVNVAAGTITGAAMFPTPIGP